MVRRGFSVVVALLLLCAAGCGGLHTPPDPTARSPSGLPEMVVLPTPVAPPATPGYFLQGFSLSPHFREQVTTVTLEPAITAHLHAPSPEHFDPQKPTLLVFYALPNGNTIAQTIGKKLHPGDDWHFDIQHIGAQTRRLREVMTDRNLIVAYLEAGGRSWPGWRKKYGTDSGPRIVAAVQDVYSRLVVAAPQSPVRFCLTGHSGGGSFIFGYLNERKRVPEEVERIGFLDSNYGYSDEDNHGDILLEWLQRDATAHLVVLAYDDREITLNGKKVLGPTGGTYRATYRMVDRFRKDVDLQETTEGDLLQWRGLGGRIDLIIHTNPTNKILHTELVGPKNGFIYSLTVGTPYENKAGIFNGPPAYDAWIQDDRAPCP